MFLKYQRRHLHKILFLILALLALVYYALFQFENGRFVNYYFESNGKAFFVRNANLSNFPEFVIRKNSSQFRWNASCAAFPDPIRLEYHNIYWQTFKDHNILMHIYNAYYDKRASLPHSPAIRFLAFSNLKVAGHRKHYCQIWFENQREPTIVAVKFYKELWNISWGSHSMNFMPYLISCLMPNHKKRLIPQSVSIVAQPCQNATNLFQIIYENFPSADSREKFGVCLKGISYPYADLSTVFIEWLEMMRILGAEKVYMSVYEIHPNMSKVIEYYKAQNFLSSRPTTLAIFTNGLPNFEQFGWSNFCMNRRCHEVIQYNDCFYRNIYKYEFLAVVDIDEIIMPLDPYKNWLELLKAAKNQTTTCTHNTAAFCFRHIIFPLSYVNGFGSPPLHFSKHLQRRANHSGKIAAAKCFHNTTNVLAVHNHFPLAYVRYTDCIVYVPTKIAQMQHYRYVVLLKEEQDELVTDNNINRFSDILTKRTLKVFYDLGFITDE